MMVILIYIFPHSKCRKSYEIQIMCADNSFAKITSTCTQYSCTYRNDNLYVIMYKYISYNFFVHVQIIIYRSAHNIQNIFNNPYKFDFTFMNFRFFPSENGRLMISYYDRCCRASGYAARKPLKNNENFRWHSACRFLCVLYVLDRFAFSVRFYPRLRDSGKRLGGNEKLPVSSI